MKRTIKHRIWCDIWEGSIGIVRVSYDFFYPTSEKEFKEFKYQHLKGGKQYIKDYEKTKQKRSKK